MITVHGFSPSGNCHKVKLLLEQLGRPYRWVEIDSSRGQTRTSRFLALNPNGRVPLIELDDGRRMAPADSPRRAAELARCVERGRQALAVMEQHLATHDWFSGDGYGIADIALFAYTDVAGDGGFELTSYPAIGRWLARIRATPGFVPLPPPTPEVAALLAIP